MPWSEMIVMVAIVSAIVLATIHVLRLIGIAIMHRTIRKTIDKDPAAAEPLLTRLTAPVEAKGGDDRTATLLIAFGIAMVVASLVIGDTNWMHYAIAGAVFPLIIGTALWLRHYRLDRSQRTDRAERQ
jgi:membrane associated rhomboid family serine protease